MFEYEKVFKKLKELDQLPKKKRKKVLNTIFSDDFKVWFYGTSESSDGRHNSPPNINSMIKAVIAELAKPKNIKIITKHIESKNYDEFDHTDSCIAYVVIEQAINMLNDTRNDLNAGMKDGSINSKEAKNYKNKIEEYNDQIKQLVSAVQDKSHPYVKKLSKSTNLPKDFVMATHFLIPSPKYILKHRINGMMEALLREIYRFTGSHGIEYVSSINWHNYFGTLFGDNLTASTALSIVMEGVRRIDSYRDLPHFDSVREIWDSLTNYAMNELNDAPENVRRQMLDIYMKRAERIYRNGDVRLRVDFLNIPNEYNNLSNSMTYYMDRLAKIMHRNISDNFNKFNRQNDRKNNNYANDTENSDNDSEDPDSDEEYLDTSELGKNTFRNHESNFNDSDDDDDD